ncbi:MAG: hypothetical protein ACJAS4_002758 [Bacteriovoracaceae bacterium]|jgi:hypothetical protein
MKTLTIKIIFLFLMVSLFGCETKEYENGKTINSSGQDLHESTFSSELKFSGATSLFDITDSTVSLSWTDIEGAVEYYIYDSSSGTPVLHSKINAPESSLKISNLESGRIYSFIVRVKDELKLLDDNTNIVSARTLATPDAPTFLSRVTPVKENGVDRNPEIVVFGVNSGDTVELFSDACITKIGEETSRSSFVVIKSDQLVPGVTYSIHAKRTNHNNISSMCSTVSVSYGLKSCPDGYITVPENPSLNIQEFCVMAYEARAWVDLDSDDIVDSTELHFVGCNEIGCTTKNWGTTSYSPGSSTHGPPWRMLDANTAKAECRSLGENYDLISNLEWMTIAENLEKVADNWSGLSVGDGCLYKGNTGVDDLCSYNAGGIEYGILRSSKASMKLSNAEIIMDFSGNIAEWVDWGQEDLFTRAPVYCEGEWGEITNDFCDSSFESTDFMPFNPARIPASTYLNSYGVGLIEGGPGGHIVRGGAYLYGAKSGIYSASLSQSENTAREEIGFRCVYRIPHP